MAVGCYPPDILAIDTLTPDTLPLDTLPLDILPSIYPTPQYPTPQIPYPLEGTWTKDTLPSGKDVGPEIPYHLALPVNRQTPLNT